LLWKGSGAKKRLKRVAVMAFHPPTAFLFTSKGRQALLPFVFVLGFDSNGLMTGVSLQALSAARVIVDPTGSTLGITMAACSRSWL